MRAARRIIQSEASGCYKPPHNKTNRHKFTGKTTHKRPKQKLSWHISATAHR
jgi:hypothetical protein